MTNSTHTMESRAERVRQRRELGDTFAAIAANEGVTRQRVAQIAATVGAPRFNAAAVRTELKLDRVYRAAASGPVSTRHLAALLGCGDDHARRLARRADLERTPAGWVRRQIDAPRPTASPRGLVTQEGAGASTTTDQMGGAS